MAMWVRGGGVSRRGRPVANVELMEQMRDMYARMEAMELARKREPDLGDDSEWEVECNILILNPFALKLYIM